MVFNSRASAKPLFENEVTLTSLIQSNFMFSSIADSHIRHILKVRVKAHQHSTPGSFILDTGPPGVKLVKEIFTSTNSNTMQTMFLSAVSVFMTVQ